MQLCQHLLDHQRVDVNGILVEFLIGNSNQDPNPQLRFLEGITISVQSELYLHNPIDQPVELLVLFNNRIF